MIYVIRKKDTQKVLFVSSQLSSEPLKVEDIYSSFDPQTMELGKTDKSYIPAYFNIDNTGRVIELTLEEKVTAGIPVMGSHQKLIDGQIVDKTVKELFKEGQTNLEIIKKQVTDTFSAFAFEGRRQLIPDYRLENATLGVYDEQTTANYKATVEAFRDEFFRLRALVEQAKTIEEIEAISANFPKEIASAAKLVELLPTQKLVGEEIVEKTTAEMLKEGLLMLDDVKQKRIQFFSDLSIQKRAVILPDYKLQNALMGLYDEQTLANYKATVQAFRDEFHRLEALIESAKTLNKIEAVEENFPMEIIIAPSA